jgi:ribosome production factor 2
MMLDFFRGENPEGVNLKGIEHVVAFTGNPDGTIHMRVYTIDLMKSGCRLPRVELKEMGPFVDFEMRRTMNAPEDLQKAAMKKPKELKQKKEKNIEHNILGDKLGRIHMERQDFSKLQTRKMKGLKRSAVDEEDNEPLAKRATL